MTGHFFHVFFSSNILSCDVNLACDVLIPIEIIRHHGYSNGKRSGMLVEKFELNPLRRPICAWLELFCIPKRCSLKRKNLVIDCTLEDTLMAKISVHSKRDPWFQSLSETRSIHKLFIFGVPTPPHILVCIIPLDSDHFTGAIFAHQNYYSLFFFLVSQFLVNKINRYPRLFVVSSVSFT